jgi:hypothetical protein
MILNVLMLVVTRQNRAHFDNQLLPKGSARAAQLFGTQAKTF